MKFGKSTVNSFRGEFLFFLLKKKHAHTWFVNRIIKEICIHKFNLPKFRCSMHFSYEITQSTKGK